MVASAHKTRITALMPLALACLLCSGGRVDTHAEVSISGVDLRCNIGFAPFVVMLKQIARDAVLHIVFINQRLAFIGLDVGL